MSQRRNNRSHYSHGDRYFPTGRDSTTRERYARNGPLSPLRSPINKDKQVSNRNNRTDNNRSSKSQLDFCIKTSDFPPLEQIQMTPEIGPIKHNSTNLDWAAQVDTFEQLAAEENDNLKTYRRKLEMGTARKPKLVMDMEEDSATLMRRQKSIDYGKNTPGYASYLRQVKRYQRRKGHPCTPNKYVKTSRRSWDMQVKLWRRSLHQFDAPTSTNKSADVSMTDSSSEYFSALEKTFDSDISDNGSELLDYRNSQNNENFSHHFPEPEVRQPNHSSPKNSLSLIDDNEIDSLIL
ncbi:histone RNA hairpin-binding protein-like isoform X2 [Patella vulgata]|uniref:histone RNA hairpin-binding protein-like isoform X2 n=1 Tax=Patella vulgata TaxID=6465 RepID=UPI0024A8C263|nr:histone RNA hairpin-binding protein-like isoform X2 [Patella vulgata]